MATESLTIVSLVPVAFCITVPIAWIKQADGPRSAVSCTLLRQHLLLPVLGVTVTRGTPGQGAHTQLPQGVNMLGAWGSAESCTQLQCSGCLC